MLLCPTVASNLPPHLIERDGKKLCSACELHFPAYSKPSLRKRFAEHVRKAHDPAPKIEEKKPSSGVSR